MSSEGVQEHSFKLSLPNFSNLKNELRFAGVYYTPLHLHAISGISIDGSTIAIADGSQWQVYPGHMKDVQFFWHPSDSITLCLADLSSFTGAPYHMVNQRTGTCVDVKLKLGPFVHAPMTQHIQEINYHTMTLTLVTPQGICSHWHIEPSELYYLQSWQRGQAVIIGIKGIASDWIASYDKILINCELNDYVTATQY